jgi:uncharacterized membrane-anchored protein YhcB (DUF1043 family)
MEKIKAFFEDYKESIMKIFETIAEFVKSILGKEFEGEAFGDIL